MKILYVIDGLGGGGTERSLAELLPPLAARGVEPEVVCLERRRGAHDALEAAGVPVAVLPAGGWPRRLAALRRRIAAARPALVHTALLKADLAGRLAAIGSGVPVIGSLVSTPYAPVRLSDPAVRPGRLRRARLADAVTARWLCDHFHAVSHAAREAAVAALGVPAERITVVPRGRDPGRLGALSPERRRRARAAFGVAEDAELLVAAGRHEFAKGFPDLIAAVARLAPRRPRLAVLVAGRPGALTAELERAIRGAGLADCVRLLGHRDDLPELLAAADLLAFPSLYEGMPGAVIEAMALGLPVVASDIPPVGEVVEAGASALLAPAGDPEALAAALEAVLADPARAAALGRRGREIFFERFTLDRSVQGMLDLYRGLLDGRRPAPPRPANAAPDGGPETPP
jgi:glycosyltransferase involved in cell wall biosynthesis